MDRLAWKAKVGLVVVSSSTVCEGRYPRVAPPDVGFFTSRMLLNDGGLSAMEAMEAHAARAVEELASVPVDAIAYCCTVSGALRGVERDRDFCRDMERRWGIPVTSTMLAVTEALHHLNARRIVVTSPYPDDHHEAEHAYLKQTGIEAMTMRGMGLKTGAEFARVTPEEILQFSLDAWDDTADGLFISVGSEPGDACGRQRSRRRFRRAAPRPLLARLTRRSRRGRSPPPPRDRHQPLDHERAMAGHAAESRARRTPDAGRGVFPRVRGG
jgi:maleate isomerase